MRLERDEGDNIAVVLAGAGAESRIVGSHLLVAAGRQPNSDTLNLGAAGIEPDERGYIPVDERCHTAVNGIWALGDITGAPPFTHTAYDDFRVIRAELFGDGERTRHDRLLTYAVFTDPQLGRVGLTEAEALEKGLDSRTPQADFHIGSALPMKPLDRFRRISSIRGGNPPRASVFSKRPLRANHGGAGLSAGRAEDGGSAGRAGKPAKGELAVAGGADADDAGGVGPVDAGVGDPAHARWPLGRAR